MLIKPEKDLKLLKESGALMGEILEKLAKLVAPGISTLSLDVEAEKMIRACGGEPAFKGYKIPGVKTPYPATVCISLNEEIVHGIPRADRIIKNGDLVSLDIGMVWPAKKGVYTDTAVTVCVGGKAPARLRKLLNVTQEALEVGIKAAQPGASIASIGKAIEAYVKSQGKFGIVRDLVGHGVGHAVHEDPNIPNYYDPALEAEVLRPGMVIAIEPMISLGGWSVVTLPDEWTIKMRDNSLCAHFEHTLIITQRGNEVVTRRPQEK
jgi:methionyl aminopeptidase